MRVVFQREPEMTDVARLIDGLRHRAHDGSRDQQRVGAITDLLQQVAQVLRLHLLGRRQPEAELAQELAQRLEAVDLRQAVHAVERRDVMPVEETRRRDVGRDHALLDQPVGIVARLLDERGDAPVRVELELELGRVELERAAPGALAREAPVDAVQREQALTQRFEARRVRRARALEEFTHFTIGQPRRRAHHALEESRPRDPAVVAHPQLAAQAQAVLVGHQRAQAVRERLRQHRDDAVREIHRRAALARLRIECAARLDVVPHVGNRDDQPPAAAARALAIDGVVVVLRVLAVDGDERRVAQVLAAGDRGLGNPRAVRRGLVEHRGRKLVRQSVRVDRDVGFHARRAVLAEHARHAADRLRRAARLLGQLDDHDLARLGPAELRLRHQHPVGEARVVRSQVGDAGLDVQATDDLARAPLEHLDDRALRLAAEARSLDAHGHAVAVHHFAHLLGRKMDRRRGVVGQQHAVAVALRLHRADGEARKLLAQAVLAAAVEHDFAVLDQRREPALPRRRRRPGRAPP